MDDPDIDPELQEKLQLVMACRYGKFKDDYGEAPWQSTTIPMLVAGKRYELHKDVLSNLTSVSIDGESIWCYGEPDF
jgi:hypothetical protein